MKKSVPYKSLTQKFKCDLLLAVAINLAFFFNGVCQYRLPADFNYNRFKDSILGISAMEAPDSVNIFDDDEFIPERDHVDKLFGKFDLIWTSEQNWPGISLTDQNAGRINLASLKAFQANNGKGRSGSCKMKECILFAEVIKSKQILYLYLEGVLVDSFDVSTGVNGRETPNFSLHPSGPVFTRYTSGKFPGGNYMGLGNMPYAVFVKGGYAIHGTTQGNFSTLGRRASHGCIRLHPDNARIFISLIRQIGLLNTWITIKDF